MKDLETLNPRPGTASNAMCTFMAINTSSIQLIPVTVVGILAARGSANPSSIIGTSFASTCIAAVCAVSMVKFLEKLPVFRLPPLTAEDNEKRTVETIIEKATDPEVKPNPIRLGGQAALCLYFFGFATLVSCWLLFPAHFKTLPFDPSKDGPVVRVVKTLSLISIPLVLTFFPLYAFVRGIKIYEEFVEGAKEGFSVILRIIPNLVAILAAIGFFRGAGGIALLTKILSRPLNWIHFPPELLPMALIRPLSGSGSLAVFTDIVNTYGPDHILSKTAGTIFGSTETTFYVLAVYFGSVSVKRTRHAVPAGLVADFVGIMASIFICKMVFK
jgi:spore maturation protein SpmB